MNDLVILVKVLSALYYAKKLKDKNLIGELTELFQDLPAPNQTAELFTKDRELRESIKATIQWLLKQPEDEDSSVIKSLLLQRIKLITRDDEQLREIIENGFEDFESEEALRRVVYKHITEIRLSFEEESFVKKFKDSIKKFFYKDIADLEKSDWANLIDLIQERVNKTYDDHQSEVIHSVTTDKPESFHDVIELVKKETGDHGIMKTPFQGLNQAMAPDYGFKRGKHYLFNALTNRGKSFTMAHLLMGVGMYNKPLLRNKAKIPTLMLESAEDTMDLIVMRMYKLALTVREGRLPDVLNDKTDDIVSVIVDCFKSNGWFLIINQIEPSLDTIHHMFQRVRQLELKGHEIFLRIYDYPALMDFDKTPGDTRSDKLQIHYRKIRAFHNARGIAFLGPHQLSPAAKAKLQETDEQSEIYFAREVGGKSYTETSTKITNEVDFEATIHIAKTGMGKSYFTMYVGKMRGEGAPEPDRFFIYDIDPVLGLLHDINGKPAFRRSLSHRLNENGEEVADWDHL